MYEFVNRVHAQYHWRAQSSGWIAQAHSAWCFKKSDGRSNLPWLAKQKLCLLMSNLLCASSLFWSFGYLQPHLQKLDAGKVGFATSEETFSALKKRKLDKTPDPLPRPSDAEIDQSSKVVHAWLATGVDSPLRMLIVLLSCGGAKLTYVWTRKKKTTKNYSETSKIWNG